MASSLQHSGMPFPCGIVFKWPGWFFVFGSERPACGLSPVPKAGPRGALVLTWKVDRPSLGSVGVLCLLGAEGAEPEGTEPHLCSDHRVTSSEFMEVHQASFSHLYTEGEVVPFASVVGRIQ